MKAHDVMIGSLVTCPPDTSVAEVARLMRDSDTGDVLVTQDHKLVGIVTDRDIAVRVAAKELDPREVPIKQFMSRRVVTGQPNWDLEKVAKEMGKHQIRRLPITQNGSLVGIISLGDLALRNGHQKHVSKSLKEISQPRGVHRLQRGRNRLLGTLGLGLAVGAVLALTLSPKQVAGLWGQLREQIQDSHLGDRLADALDLARDRIAELRA
ncbi:MAG: CBS domain-containing protein [Chloroflexi bacterium]|nr:CBS domain-containing protein [Chloroflexota bacterium]